MTKILKRLNNKGLSIVEILVCFVIVAVVAIALLNTLMEYKTEEQIETIKSHVESYKNTVTRVIQTDITDNAIVGYSGKVLTHNDDEYKLEITLVYQKPFDNGSTTKLLTIYRNDEESYIMYPDIVKDDLGNYVAHDVKYKLEETSKVLDEEENKEFNDLNFPYITENMVRVKDGNTLTIDIPITHNELGTSYHIKIVAPLQLISAKNQAPPTTCSITYNHGTGATACDPQKKIVGVGEQWGELCTTTKPGYSLKSWKTADNCGGTEIYPEEECGTNINHYTVIAYPCWEVKTYILTLVPQGNYSGATTRTMKYKTNNNNNVGADSKTGYKFKGWYTTQTGGTQVYNDEGKNVKASTYWTAAYSTGTWKYDGNLTLYARFTANTYTLTLNPNGGTYNSTTSTSTKTMTYDSTNNNSIGKPTRLGYTFDGWYTAKTNGTKIYDNSGKNLKVSGYWSEAHNTGKWIKSSNVTLYAHWIPTTFDLTYTLDGGTHGSSHPNSADYGTAFTINKPSKSIKLNFSNGTTGATINYSSPSSVTASGKTVSYTFKGWDISGMDSTSHIVGGASSSSTTATEITGTQYKNLRSASGTVAFAAKWTAPTITLPKVTKTGYTCRWTSSGISDKASGGTYKPSDINGATERSFTAACEPKSHTIEYALDGGSHGSLHPTSANYGTTYTVSNPSKSIQLIFTDAGTGATINYASPSSVSASGKSVGYTFKGWDISGMDTTTHNIAGTSSTSTTATGIKGTTFSNLRASSGTVTFTAKWTAPTITLPKVTKPGYTCKWTSSGISDKASGGTYKPSDINGATSRTFTASCSANTVKITYNGNGNTGGSTAATTCNYNQSCTLRSNGFTKSGYKFEGWYTKASGGSKYGSTTTITSNTTVYAHWSKNVTASCTNGSSSWSNSSSPLKFSGTAVKYYNYKKYDASSFIQTTSTSVNVSYFKTKFYADGNNGSTTSETTCYSRYDNQKPYTPYWTFTNNNLGDSYWGPAASWYCNSYSTTLTTTRYCTLKIDAYGESKTWELHDYFTNSSDQSETITSGCSGFKEHESSWYNYAWGPSMGYTWRGATQVSVDKAGNKSAPLKVRICFNNCCYSYDDSSAGCAYAE